LNPQRRAFFYYMRVRPIVWARLPIPPYLIPVAFTVMRPDIALGFYPRRDQGRIRTYSPVWEQIYSLPGLSNFHRLAICIVCWGSGIRTRKRLFDRLHKVLRFELISVEATTFTFALFRHTPNKSLIKGLYVYHLSSSGLAVTSTCAACATGGASS
jgi:hypothetical protein